MQNNEEKQLLINIINEITKLDLIDISFEGIERFENIIEYEFYIIKLKGISKQNVERNFFIKKIARGKIKESLFCICNLTYEKYFYEDKSENKKIQKKISILEKKEIKYINKVSVNLFEENLIKEKVNIEIYFIEMSKIIEYTKKNKIIEGSKYIDFNLKDILMIGIENA